MRLILVLLLAGAMAFAQAWSAAPYIESVEIASTAATGHITFFSAIFPTKTDRGQVDLNVLCLYDHTHGGYWWTTNTSGFAKSPSQREAVLNGIVPFLLDGTLLTFRIEGGDLVIGGSKEKLRSLSALESQLLAGLGAVRSAAHMAKSSGLWEVTVPLIDPDPPMDFLEASRINVRVRSKPATFGKSLPGDFFYGLDYLNRAKRDFIAKVVDVRWLPAGQFAVGLTSTDAFSGSERFATLTLSRDFTVLTAQIKATPSIENSPGRLQRRRPQ